MTLIMPPTSGGSVSILAPHARLRGHVTGRGHEALTVELEQTAIRRPFRFPAGSQVEVEWTHQHGVMQLTATVGSSRDEPHPTLELQLVGEAEPVERRDNERVSVNLDVSAWTLAQPTRRLTGNTVDLSIGGALLWLPELAPFAATIEARIGLPRKPLQVSAVLLWRRDPALVGVQFERISPDAQARLVDFLHGPR